VVLYIGIVMVFEIDSFYVETVDSERPLTAIWTGAGARSYGQTFKLSDVCYKLTSCKFRIKRGGTPLTGNLRAYLYAHTGTFGDGGIPTGDVLATSDELDMSTITTSYVLYTFTFDGTYTLVANTAYCLVLYSLDGNLSGSVYPRIAARAIGTHEGNGLRYLSSVGAWEAYSTIDVMFYVYGNIIDCPSDEPEPEEPEEKQGFNAPVENIYGGGGEGTFTSGFVEDEAEHLIP